jgi:SEC-C motif-containing protein
MACPCGSNQAYHLCCGQYHGGNHLPDTAEQLMRSRYSAFVLAKVDYLAQTQANDAAHNFNAQATMIWTQSVEWLKLEIIDAPCSLGKETASVSYKAWYKEHVQLQCLYEKSLFQRIAGKWWYVSGIHLNITRGQYEV